MKRIGILIAIPLLLTLACAKSRHVAVQVDATVSTVVFAVDDAELAACQSGALTAAQCDSLNPKIKAALQDLKAVTAALQATPKTGTVPQSLPALIQTLRSVQAIALSLPPSNATSALVAKVNTALDAVIGLLSKIAGS